MTDRRKAVDPMSRADLIILVGVVGLVVFMALDLVLTGLAG